MTFKVVRIVELGQCGQVLQQLLQTGRWDVDQGRAVLEECSNNHRRNSPKALMKLTKRFMQTSLWTEMHVLLERNVAVQAIVMDRTVCKGGTRNRTSYEKFFMDGRVAGDGCQQVEL